MDAAATYKVVRCAPPVYPSLEEIQTDSYALKECDGMQLCIGQCGRNTAHASASSVPDAYANAARREVRMRPMPSKIDKRELSGGRLM